MKKRLSIRTVVFFVSWLLFQAVPSVSEAQENNSALKDSASVEDCLKYAFKNQPFVKQLKLDEQISVQSIRVALSDWLPQINASAMFQKNLKLPVIYFPDFSNPSGPKIPVNTGVNYNSAISFALGQTIFDRDVYLAGSTAGLIRKQSAQTSRSALIDLVVQVSKSYYSVLLSVEQLRIIQEDIDRLTIIQHDAWVSYQNGVSDNIDYKRATISLNNSIAQKRSAEESIKSKLSILKQLIGYPNDKTLLLKNNYKSLRDDILLDTLRLPDFNKRIEYQLLKTNLSLQKSNLLYNKLSFLPTISGFANYNINYQNDLSGDLYKKSFPNSAIGLTLGLPLFQGTRRIQNIKKARLEYERLSLDTLRLRDQISSEYVQSMAGFQSNLEAYRETLKNMDITMEVYNTTKLQYTQGVKAYLEVIVSETDLMAARINNLNALYTLMFSKLDVERSLGNISIDY
jgi:outer membrane protein TolC